MLQPIYRWVWADAIRRGRNLLRFAEVEADGGRDIARAAELTGDPQLRRLFLRHAADENRHAELFRTCGAAILLELKDRSGDRADIGWLTPGERGLDDLQVRRGGDDALLAFLHLSEKTAARDFAAYHAAAPDERTREVFAEVLRDEEFHMRYTYAQLGRVAPERRRWLIWRSRLTRLWKAYLRFASALAGLIGGVVLTLQYFIVLPPFAWLAKRAARREPDGWCAARPQRPDAMRREY